MTSPAGGSKARSLPDDALLLAPAFCCCGLVTFFPFVFMGMRADRRAWKIAALIYGTVAVVGTLLMMLFGDGSTSEPMTGESGTSPVAEPVELTTGSTIGAVLLMAVWVVGAIHAIILREEWRQLRHAQNGNSVGEGAHVRWSPGPPPPGPAQLPPEQLHRWAPTERLAPPPPPPRPAQLPPEQLHRWAPTERLAPPPPPPVVPPPEDMNTRVDPDAPPPPAVRINYPAASSPPPPPPPRPAQLPPEQVHQSAPTEWLAPPLPPPVVPPPEDMDTRVDPDAPPSPAVRINYPAPPSPQQPPDGLTQDADPLTDGPILPVPTTSGRRARTFAAGDTIGGSFEVEEVLGSGGFSTVYLVRDIVEDEQRALKLFNTAHGFEAARREIGALRRIDHPHVVKVFSAGRTEHGGWYLVTEFIDGERLDEYTTGGKHLRDREAVDVALDVLDALVAIHPDSERLEALDQAGRERDLSGDEYDERMSIIESSLVHRDIKPHNIMLTRAGAKLLDFNIASRVGDPVRTVSGTPPYQAPDADLTQWDVSTDLFAVGVTLYELLCDGEHPYPQATPAIDVTPRNPRQFRKDLDPALSRLLLKACANDRDVRFATAAQMQADLRAIRTTQ